MSANPLVLALPLPESPNRWKKHPMEAHRQKNDYRRACWAAAIQQAMPKATEDLPEHVTVCACLYVRQRRDDDNAMASLKFALDALKAQQPEGANLNWRQGCYESKGYWIDDDPTHCTVAKPEQRVDRQEPRLVLAIYANEQEQAA